MAIATANPRIRRRPGRAARTPYLLIAPAVVAMLGFLVYPMASVIYYSLQNYNVTKPWDNGFAGLDNFRQAAVRGSAVLAEPRLQRQVGRRRGLPAAACSAWPWR